MTGTTSERGIAKAKARQAEDIDIEKVIITTLMSTVAGRRWVWLQLSFAQIFAEDSGVEPYQMAYAKGQRVAGLRLLGAVTKYAPAMYVRMTEEASGLKLKENEDGRDPE